MGQTSLRVLASLLLPFLPLFVQFEQFIEWSTATGDFTSETQRVKLSECGSRGCVTVWLQCNSVLILFRN